MQWLVNGELANIFFFINGVFANIFFFITVVVVFLVLVGCIYGNYDSNEYIVRCFEPFLVTVCESNFLAMDDSTGDSFMFLSFVLLSVCVCPSQLFLCDFGSNELR